MEEGRHEITFDECRGASCTPVLLLEGHNQPFPKSFLLSNRSPCTTPHSSFFSLPPPPTLREPRKEQRAEGGARPPGETAQAHFPSLVGRRRRRRGRERRKVPFLPPSDGYIRPLFVPAARAYRFLLPMCLSLFVVHVVHVVVVFDRVPHSKAEPKSKTVSAFFVLCPKHNIVIPIVRGPRYGHATKMLKSSAKGEK